MFFGDTVSDEDILRNCQKTANSTFVRERRRKMLSSDMIGQTINLSNFSTNTSHNFRHSKKLQNIQKYSQKMILHGNNNRNKLPKTNKQWNKQKKTFINQKKMDFSSAYTLPGSNEQPFHFSFLQTHSSECKETVV